MTYRVMAHWKDDSVSGPLDVSPSGEPAEPGEVVLLDHSQTILVIKELVSRLEAGTCDAERITIIPQQS